MQKQSLLLSAIIALSITSTTKAAQLNVTPSGPYTTIQAAIDAATNGDTVIVADGIWTGNGNRDIDFKDKAITVKSANGPKNCIIDCQATPEDPHCGFLVFANSVRIEGLTITNGGPVTDSRALDIDAGGIYIHLMLTNVVISDCVVVHNEGIGIEEHGMDTVISRCNVSDNSGYGILLATSGSKLKKTTVARNSTGIDCGSGNAVIQDCTVIENRIGIKVHSNSTLVTDCLISRNIIMGAICDAHYCVFQRCQITNNKGTGIQTRNGKPTIVDCLIAENEGHGIEAGQYTYVYNCTIVNNHSQENGGGILAWECVVSDSIIAGNTAAKGNQIYIREEGDWSGAYFGISRSLVEGGRNKVFKGAGATFEWGSGMIDDDPNFAFATDYHLRSSSVCIDKGPRESLGGGDYNDYDLDGYDRTRSKSGNSTGYCDFGAYEYCGHKPTIAISKKQLEFSIPLGKPGLEESVVAIRNVGGQPLNWQLQKNRDWVQINPESGTLAPDQVQKINVKVNGEALDHGIHYCQFIFSDDQAGNSPHSLPFNLKVHSTLRVPQDYDTIQEAIDDAVDKDIIIVADGRYRGQGNRDLDMKGKAIHLKSQNGPRNCIIDCQGMKRDLHRGFTFVSKEDEKTIIDGFSIMNGYENWGGAINCYLSSPLIKNCFIFGNIAGGNGGGIICDRSSPIIANCLIVGNNATRGAGLLGAYGNPKIVNSTVAMNNATSYTGGIYFMHGKLSLYNSILWGNRDRTGNGKYSQRFIYGTNHTDTLYYNCIEGWSSKDPNGIGNFSKDPLFVDPRDGDFRLTSDSPCIDAGDPNGSYLTDLNEDFQNDNRISFGRIDIGADEFVSFDLHPDNMINLSDFAALASHWNRQGCADTDWCDHIDFSSDSFVGMDDFALFSEHWLADLSKSNLLLNAHWKFDENSGTTASDNSPFLRLGTLLNMDDPDWTTGKNGNALAFDGIDDFIRISGYKGIGGESSRTVTAWIKTTDTAGEIIGWGTNAIPGGRWIFSTESTGRLRLAVGGGAIVGSTFVCDDQWHHVAVVMENDGSPNINEIKLFVDGLPDTSSSASDRDIKTITDPETAPDIRIGVYLASGNYFKGLIDELRIHNRALTIEEVANLQ